MRRYFAVMSALSACVGLQACSGDDTTSNNDAPDAARPDGADSGGGGTDSAPNDSGGQQDVAARDASDAGCPSTWVIVPTVDPSIAVPQDGGSMLLHASATGTQDYTCKAVTTDAGPGHQWTFVGPAADLANCAGQKIGQHFASDGGPTLPEWITTADGTYVIAKRLAGFTPDGGASAVPWLLLQEQSTGGTGLLAKTAYVQRLNTTGGIAPTAATCDQNAEGTTQHVPYTADYYFFGTP